MAASGGPARSQPPVLLASLCAAALIVCHVSARTCRDALFLSTFPLDALPKIMAVAAVISFATVIAASRAIPRHGPGRVIASLLLVSALLHLVQWRLLAVQRELAVVFVYLHTSSISAIAVSGFWSIVSELFDPHALRRSAGYIAAGSATGGLLGGVLVQMANRLSVDFILVPLAVMATLTALAVQRLAAGVRKSAPDSERPNVSGVTGSPYLRSMALLVALTGLTSALVDFAFKATVSTELASTALVGFFAAFYTTTSIASVVLQLSLARWVPAHFGLGVSLAVLPSVLAGVGSLALALSSSWVVVVLRGAAVALETSLFRAAYEPLYAPVPVLSKRAAKTVIDVACSRLGEVTGSGWVLLVASLAPALVTSVGLGTAVLAAVVCIALSLRLERGYVAELALSLRSGRMSVVPHEMLDATTRLTLSRTGFGIDRELLLRQIEEMRALGDGASQGGARPAAPARAPKPLSPESARLLSRAEALISGEPARVRAALAEGRLDLSLVSLVVPLLGAEGAADAAVIALRRVAPHVVGQLCDVMLDPEQPLRVRRRVPRVLRACEHPRAVRGLVEALVAPEFELRERAALALRDLSRKRPSLKPPARVLLDAARRELEREPATHPPGAPSGPPWADEELEESGDARPGTSRDRTIDHVFTLIGLAVDDEALELARLSLASQDQKLRGTALEYLEHVLPEPIRSMLWPRLQAGYVPRPTKTRPAAEIADELKRSFG